MSQRTQLPTSSQATNPSPHSYLSSTSITKLLSHSIFHFHHIPFNKTDATKRFHIRLNELHYRLQLALSIHSHTLSYFIELVDEIEQWIDAERGNLSLIFNTPLRHFRRQLEFYWHLDTQSIHDDAQLLASLHGPPQDAIAKKCRCNATCQICFHNSNDSLIECATCKVVVHSLCYRVSCMLADTATAWKCHFCRWKASVNSDTSNIEPLCQACYQMGGALLPTSSPSQWIHMSCALNLPLLTLEMQIQGPSGKPQHTVRCLDRLEPLRKLQCCFCKKQNEGACASCTYDACGIAYHVPCALQNGIRFMKDGYAGSSVSGCMLHQVQVLTSISAMPTNDLESTMLCGNCNGLSAHLGASIFEAIDRDLIQNTVMVLVPSLPLELSLIKSQLTVNNKSVRAFGLSKSLSNSLKKAMTQGILHENDILLAVNDTLCIDRDAKIVNKVLQECTIVPAHCWFLKLSFKEDSKPGKIGMSAVRNNDLVAPKLPAIDSTPQPANIKHAVEKETPIKRKRLFSASFEGDLNEPNWPWACYLRSDGKSAMNMVWKSIEMACYQKALSTRSKYEKLGLKLNCLLGIAFFPYNSQTAFHEEFGAFQSLTSLLCVPSSPEEDKCDLPSESLSLRDREDEEFAELDPLRPNITVTVAKRTWPGINKLGGTGRIKKHHLERRTNDGRAVYSYDVTYVLGGREKRIARKYIKLLDLESESSKHPESHPINSYQTTESTGCNSQLFFQQKTSEWTSCAPINLYRPKCALQLQFTVSDERVCVIDLNSNEKIVSTAAECFVLPKFPIRTESASGDPISQKLARFQAKLALVSSAVTSTIARLHDAISKEFLTTRGSSKDHNVEYHEQRVRAIEAAHSKEAWLELLSLRPNSFALSKPPEAQDCTFGGVFVNAIHQEDGEPCILCELSGGDLASTSEGDVVHPQCAMYTPETFFQQAKVFGINEVPISDRLALVCGICHSRKGLSKLQCAFATCTQAYHVGCALVHGYLIQEPQYIAWCPKHLSSSMEIEWPKHIPKRRRYSINS